MDQIAMAKPMATGSADATEVLQAAERGMAAFGTAQELTVKALMRAATRQAELARAAMADCVNVAACACQPLDGRDVQAPMSQAGLTAESWMRTWYSIGEDLNHDLLEAAEAMFGAHSAAPARTNGKDTAAR